MDVWLNENIRPLFWESIKTGKSIPSTWLEIRACRHIGYDIQYFIEGVYPNKPDVLDEYFGKNSKLLSKLFVRERNLQNK